MSIAWSPELSLYIALAGWDGNMLLSSDGISWSLYSTGVSTFLGNVVWAGGQFIAVGVSGLIITSPDGINWTQQITGTILEIANVVWTGSQYVAIGGSNGTICLTSPDGVVWTDRTAGIPSSGMVFGIEWSGTELVAVGWGGEIFRSLDGIEWTSEFSGSSSNLWDVIWSGSEFLSVGNDGVIISSSNGIDWASQGSGVTDILNGIANSDNTYVAVGGSQCKSLIIIAETPFLFESLTHNATDPMTVVYGSPEQEVQWNTSVSGGSGQYEYRYWAMGPETGNVWQILQNWSSNSQLNWMVDETDEGLTTITVIIRDINTLEVVSGTYSDFEVQVTYQPLAFGSLGHDSTDPLTVVSGNPPETVVWSGSATGGSGSYQYRYWMMGPETGNGWQIVQDWSGNSQLNWMVDETDKGMTTVVAVIRDTITGEVVSGTYSDFEVQVTYQPLAFGTIGHNSTDPLVVVSGNPEQTVQWNASAVDGSGQYEYRYWMYGPETGNAWMIKQDYSGNSQLNWMVDETDAGQTTVTVIIRDVVTGEKVSGTYSNFTVQVQ